LLLLYSDEASVSLVPVLSRTYAPIGKTPCITISTEVSARLYIASAISPEGDLFYFVRNQPFDSKAIIEYLTYLKQQINRQMLIIWDGASIHSSQEVKQWLATQKENDFFLVKQPHYSPELNADEQVWHRLKSFEMKNTCNRNVNELKPKIIAAMENIKHNRILIQNFFKNPNLGYY